MKKQVLTVLFLSYWVTYGQTGIKEEPISFKGNIPSGASLQLVPNTNILIKQFINTYKKVRWKSKTKILSQV